MATSRRGVRSRLTLEMLVCRTWAALERDATLHPSHHRRERSSQAPLPGRRRPGLPPATRRIGRLSSVPPPSAPGLFAGAPGCMRACVVGEWVSAGGVVSWARRRGVEGQKESRRERRRGFRGVKEKGERRRSPFPPFSITGGKTRGPGGRGKTEGCGAGHDTRRDVCCCSLPRTLGGRHGVCAGCFARACCSL